MVKKIKKEQLLIGALIGILLLVIAIPVPKTEKNEQPEVLKEEVSENEYSLEVELKEILQKIFSRVLVDDNGKFALRMSCKMFI